jgi:hypothetical protein
MRLVWVVIPLVLIGVIGAVVLVETTITLEPQITFFTDKEIYEIGEPVSITMKNSGSEVLAGSSSPCGFSILDKNGDTVVSFGGLYLSTCPFEPGEEISKTWDSKSYSGVPVRPGIYTLSAEYWDENFKQRLIFEKQIKITDPTNAFELLDSPSSSENIQMLKDSELVFSGKVISKIPGTSVPDFYTIDFKVIENFRNAKEDAVTVYTNERAWKGCAGLEEDLEYLIFAEPKNHGTMTCYNAISLPTDITNELREFSSRIPWW